MTSFSATRRYRAGSGVSSRVLGVSGSLVCLRFGPPFTDETDSTQKKSSIKEEQR